MLATTGFRPVKGSLKDVINYAENPDKTTEKRFLADDLYRTLTYAQNDDKTDQKMYGSMLRNFAYFPAINLQFFALCIGAIHQLFARLISPLTAS